MPNSSPTSNSPAVSPKATEAERERLAKLAKSRQSLKKKLDMHSAFTGAITWALASGGLYVLGTTLWSLRNTFFVDIVKNLIFGTATTPGIPVAFVQAFLPTALAPLAPILAVGIPLLLIGYMLAYQMNSNRYLNKGKNPENKQDAANDAPKAGEQLGPKNSAVPTQKAENTQEKQPVPVQSVPAAATPVTPVVIPAVTPVQTAEPVAKEQVNNKSAKSASEPQQGSRSPVLFNQKRQTRSQTKSANAAMVNDEITPQATAPKRKGTKSNQ